MAKRAAMQKKRQDWDARIKERRSHAAFTAHAKKIGPISRELVLALYPIEDITEVDSWTAHTVDRIAKLIEGESQPAKTVPMVPRAGMPTPPWLEGR